jgi:L-asparaginase/Glu-tRNA(Gln) amidotransferase subunit D
MKRLSLKKVRKGKPEVKKILILHAGGTIGMVGGKTKDEPLKPVAVGGHFLSLVPELKKMAHVSIKVLDNIDSSNVTPLHWARWLGELKKYYSKYVGFVQCR